MSKDKIVILQLTPDTMMKAIQKLCEIIVLLKDNPEFVKFIPDDPTQVAVTVLEQIVETEQSESKPVSKEDFDKSARVMREFLAKAAKP